MCHVFLYFKAVAHVNALVDRFNVPYCDVKVVHYKKDKQVALSA